MLRSSSYTILGLMSGTSLDGLDMALCDFFREKEAWRFEVRDTLTLPYSPSRTRQLAEAHTLDAVSLWSLHHEYGLFLGKASKKFLAGVPVDAIASHGHTIFHQPEKGITFQLGSGCSLAAASGIRIVCDFRSMDVVLGGQGAPLVPIGDEKLFGDYTFCLNIGGFANISYRENNQRIAFDTGPANWALNHYARKMGFEYDRDGIISSTGQVHPELLVELNALEYYQKKGPRSLGREWVEEQFLPCIDKYGLSVPDIMRTLCEHIADQISRAGSVHPNGTMLVTGGGSAHPLLTGLLRQKHGGTIIVPDPVIANFKEAIVFAFLGALKLAGEPNCLKSVTGCPRDHCAGVVYEP